MKRITTVIYALVLTVVAGVSTTGAAMADNGHFVPVRGGGHVGVYFGVPWPWYWSYPAPYPYYPYYPYYPPVQTAPSSPPVYIEQEQQQPAPPQQKYYWYYCSKPRGYYPYVRECPGGWRAVAPQPPNQP
jgi:hypothetical protein